MNVKRITLNPSNVAIRFITGTALVLIIMTMRENTIFNLRNPRMNSSASKRNLRWQSITFYYENSSSSYPLYHALGLEVHLLGNNKQINKYKQTRLHTLSFWLKHVLEYTVQIHTTFPCRKSVIIRFKMIIKKKEKKSTGECSYFVARESPVAVVIRNWNI